MPRRGVMEGLKKLFTNELLVAWIALALTLGHAALNFFYYWRGSEISVEPKSVLIYVQQGPRGSALSIALEVLVVNRSRWYGDTWIAASAALPNGIRLEGHEALILPRFATTCPPNVRCAQYDRLAVQFLDEDVLPVPPSGARTVWISFYVPCAVFNARCNANDANEVIGALNGRTWTLHFQSQFIDEGARRAVCTFGPVSMPRIVRRNVRGSWTSIRCRRPGPLTPSSPFPTG